MTSGTIPAPESNVIVSTLPTGWSFSVTDVTVAPVAVWTSDCNVGVVTAAEMPVTPPNEKVPPPFTVRTQTALTPGAPGRIATRLIDLPPCVVVVVSTRGPAWN